MLYQKVGFWLIIIMSFCPFFASYGAVNHSGYILLQVEEHGEAWYVYPKTNEKFYLGKPADAYNVMRNLGLGITNANLAKIPVGIINDNSLDSDRDGLPDYLENALGTKSSSVDSDNDDFSDNEEIQSGYNPLGSGKTIFDYNLANKLKGQILIQVEKAGQAWYVYPKNGKRYFLGSATQAFNVMKNLGQGISNTDLNKITANYPKTTFLLTDFSLSIPMNWQVANIFPSQSKNYQKLAIDNETYLQLGDNEGLLRIWELSSVSDYTLGNFEKSAEKNQEKVFSDSFVAGVKPATEQQFNYTNTTTEKNLGTFYKGSRVFFDVMLDTNNFIHFDCAIFKEENISAYKKQCEDAIKSFKLK